MPIAAIAFHNNINLLAEVRHDFRPLVCLFIRVFETGAAGFEPATDRLTADSSAVELHPNEIRTVECPSYILQYLLCHS